MINAKSKGSGKLVMTKADLTPSKCTLTDGDVGFPDVTLYRAGNVIQVIINGATKKAIASGSKKQYTTPSEFMPISAFSTLLKNSASHYITCEVNGGGISLTARDNLQLQEWVGATAIYIGNIFGGGA